MKVHLIKSAEVEKDLFTQVVDLLRAVPGPIEFNCDPDLLVDFYEDELTRHFIPDAKDFETQVSCSMISEEADLKPRDFPLEQNFADWETIFEKCQRYRKEQQIPNDTFVLLLTNIPNKYNWFAALDETMPYNGFIHTDDWDYYIGCSAAFPVAYEVIALILQKSIFNGVKSIRELVHNQPIGCMNDMCVQKKEIILKLRTADICKSCMDQLRPHLPAPTIHHALTLMESLRVKMLFAQNFKQETPLSQLLIDKQNRLYLPDFGNIEIKLRPLEKALYFLFLKHPEGIYRSSLSDHRQTLYEIYASLSNMGDMNEMKTRIDEMVNALSSSADEKISRIKRVFTDAIGKDLANHYYIHGDVAEVKKIALDRQRVVWNENA